MYTRISSDQIAKLGVQECHAELLRRFRWLGKHKELLRSCLDWQESTLPRPNFYFRWHLPRLIKTIAFIEQITQTTNILDLAAYGPFSVVMQQSLKKCGWSSNWQRTDLRNGRVELLTNDKLQAFDVLGSDLNEAKLPFQSGAFDLVLFMETIEHLNIHPQIILKEINRVLRVGGLLLVTTPNVTSRKKILSLSNGNWAYDSPTFSDTGWGHRFEFAPYILREMLKACGFGVVKEEHEDVYLDDPRGWRENLEHSCLIAGKIVSGNLKNAFKLIKNAGSTSFFLCRKESENHCPLLRL